MVIVILLINYWIETRIYVKLEEMFDIEVFLNHFYRLCQHEVLVI